MAGAQRSRRYLVEGITKTVEALFGWIRRLIFTTTRQALVAQVSRHDMVGYCAATLVTYYAMTDIIDWRNIRSTRINIATVGVINRLLASIYDAIH